jgi:signal peptidase I
MACISPFFSFLIWLIVYATIGGMLYVIFSNKMFLRKKRVVMWIYKSISLFIFYTLLRVFFFDIYCISGDSMKPTLSDGDYVFVSKTFWGPRLPRSLYEIQWVNLLTYLYPFNLLGNESTQQYSRLYSTITVERGDIVVFNIPIYQSKFGVKRCTKIPGDTIMIHDNNGTNILPNSHNQINIRDSLSTIEHRIITHYKLQPKDSLLYFHHSYFFFEGDNKEKSIDSRLWGAVQDDHIVGKVCFIVFSKETNGAFRWDRLFKKIV